jgi:hypothetical protein
VEGVALPVGVSQDEAVGDEGLWHKRVCHPSGDRLRQAARVTKGMKLLKGGMQEQCTPCIEGKLKRRKFYPAVHRAKQQLEECHTDLIGKMPIPSRNKKWYVLVIVDDYSRYSWVHGIFGKSDAAAEFILWWRQAERHSGCKLKYLRLDGGREFVGQEFVGELKSQGVMLRPTVPYTPQQNSVVERVNGVLVDMARTALRGAGLPLYWWEYAIRYANWCRNRLPTAANGGVTPYELWHGEQPSLALARPFGCMAHYWLPKQGEQGGAMGRKKWDSKARWGMFVGIPEGTQGWTLWDPGLDAFRTSCTAVFHENLTYREWKQQDPARRSCPDFPDAPWTFPDEDADEAPPSPGRPLPLQAPLMQQQVQWDGAPLGGGCGAAEALVEEPSQDAGRGDLHEGELPLGRGAQAQEAPVEEFPQVAGADDLRDVALPQVPDEGEALAEFGSGDLTGLDVLGLPRTRRHPLRRSCSKDEGTGAPLGGERRVRADALLHLTPMTAAGMVAALTTAAPQGRLLALTTWWAGALRVDAGGGRVVMAMSALPPEPRTLTQALKGPDAAGWRAACDAEYQALVDRGTWELVPRPAGRQVVSTKWVFKVKTHADGSFEKFKSRLVARGFTQRLGLDYGETYAPVGRYTTARVLLAIGCAMDWEIHVMDVSNAFLYGEIEHDIFIEQPEGYDDGSGRVCRIRQALYGLKQSPRQWNKALHEHLVSLGFVPSNFDPALYLRLHADGVILLLVYVDDLLILCSCTRILPLLKKQLMGRWQMKDLGEIKYYLGLNVKRDRGSRRLWISQPKYIAGLVNRYDVGEKRPATPLPSGFKHILEGEQPGGEAVGLSPLLSKQGQKHYQSIIGALNFAAGCSRPDIAFAVSKLASVNHCPRERHLAAAKRCMEYLAGTPELGLTFEGSRGRDSLTLRGASDSDWAGCPVTRRSTTGFIFALAGGPVSWLSKRQSETALSSCQAEFVALTAATREACWLRDLLAELRFTRRGPTPILVDNSAAVELSKHPKFHSRTKHIQLAFLYVRQQQEKGIITVQQVKTKEQPADFLTKNVDAATLQSCLSFVGMQKP